ncbi:MAG: PEP-CTERM sorting domain-containing protein, partial [Planctomycetota bacterium]
DSDTEAFDPIEDNGVGNKPGMRMNSTDHTNQLVPMYAIGVGSDQFAALTDGVDSQYLDFYSMAGLEGWGDEYIGIDDIFTVMSESIPEPTSLTLLGLTALGLMRRRQ